jgi:hypothetical protein
VRQCLKATVDGRRSICFTSYPHLVQLLWPSSLGGRADRADGDPAGWRLAMAVGGKWSEKIMIASRLNAAPDEMFVELIRMGAMYGFTC